MEGFFLDSELHQLVEFRHFWVFRQFFKASSLQASVCRPVVALSLIKCNCKFKKANTSPIASRTQWLAQ